MALVIAKVNGDILALGAKNGILVHPTTRVPIVNQEVLERIPEKDTTKEKLRLQEVAQIEENKLIEEYNEYFKKVEGLPDDIKDTVRKDLIAASKWEFANLKIQTGQIQDEVWKSSEIRRLFFSVPHKGLATRLVLGKIAEKQQIN